MQYIGQHFSLQQVFKLTALWIDILGLPLPKRLITHAHWTVNKVKMSKSLGNVVDPQSTMETYGVDPVRYFLLHAGGLLDDGDFSTDALFAALKGELADNFGNLVGRCTSVALNPSNAVPTRGPLTTQDQELVQKLGQLPGRQLAFTLINS
jgi:methionyl-tRNA synthetase